METEEIILPNGFNVVAIPKSETIIDEIWKNHFYEKDFTIQRGMTIIDIGANQGFFSLYAADKGAQVFSYEPEHTNFRILTQNIKRNKLETFIRNNKCAVGKENGEIKIFVRNYEVPFASGMVSIIKDFMKPTDVDECYNEIDEQVVQCRTLDSILESIENETIDLLKIDCEGAEMDILSGASASSMEKVKNIVMETHDVYPFSQIFYRVMELGFTIVHYEKPDGPFGTGYLFATNKTKTDNVNETSAPIAMLKIPHFAFINEPVCLDASQSFSPYKGENFSYYWHINGIWQQGIDTAQNKFTFNSPGPQQVEVEIKDRFGNVGREKQCIWIFSSNYLQNAVTYEVQDRGIAREFEIRGEQSFRISRSYFPDFWMPDKIVVGFFINDSIKSSVRLLFNGEERLFDHAYIEQVFLNFPSELDLIFKLKSDEKRIVELKWWWVRNAEKNSEIVNENGVSILNTMSIEYELTIENLNFKAPAKAFPKDWTINRIKFGIAAIPMNGIHTELNGLLKYNGMDWKLSGWYTEVGISEFCIGSDLHFSIQFQKMRKIKIVWWAE